MNHDPLFFRKQMLSLRKKVPKNYTSVIEVISSVTDWNLDSLYKGISYINDNLDDKELPRISDEALDHLSDVARRIGAIHAESINMSTEKKIALYLEAEALAVEFHRLYADVWPNIAYVVRPLEHHHYHKD